MSTLNRDAVQKILRALAWADGELDPAEATALEQCFEKLRCLHSQEDAELEESDLAALSSALPGREAREEFLEQMVRVAYADDLLTHEEFDTIRRVAEKLEFTPQEAEALRMRFLRDYDAKAFVDTKRAQTD